MIGLLIMCTGALQAQVTMTLQVPPVGVLMKNQLWNMVLVNPGAYTQLVNVNLVLLDEKTNQPVLTAVSTSVSLTKGARQLQAKDLGPVRYEYGTAAYGIDRNPNGLLPAGNYQACYSIQLVGKGSRSLAENCISVHVDPLSPPLLNTPADEAQVYTQYPQFTWLPPTPVGIFNDLSYTMVLVEVLPGQGKSEAVQRNVPVYSTGNLKQLYVNYASSTRSLDTAHLYAWRVLAQNNRQVVAMSDVWTFKVKKVTPKIQDREKGAYVELKRGLDAAVAAAGTALRFSYNNVAGDTLVAYTVTNLQDASNPELQKGNLAVKNGLNLLEVSLPTKNGYDAKGVYLFQFTNGRQETWSVKFTWTKDQVEQ